MSVEIVKVQRPIHTTDPDLPWLIYDRAEKHVEQRPARMVRREVKDKMGADYKAFFKGAWSSVVGWGLSERVADQDW
jgi:hypothetical protein